jgi:hypothetical protein
MAVIFVTFARLAVFIVHTQFLINSIRQPSTITCVTAKLKIKIEFSQVRLPASNLSDILVPHCLNGSYSSLQGFLYGERTEDYKFVPFPTAKVTTDLGGAHLSKITGINQWTMNKASNDLTGFQVN